MAQRAAERVFDRVFSSSRTGTEGRHSAKQEESSNQRNVGRQSEESLDLPDIVTSILKSWRKKDYFSVLQLPLPTVDGLGQPVWPCTPLDISRAYRRVSLAVHPDKNSDKRARQAFEAVNEVHRILKDRGKLETALKEAAVDARLRKERQEAKASVVERIALNASRNSERKRMRQQQGAQFQQEILRQVREKQLRGSRKREREGRSKATENWDGVEPAEMEEEDDTDEDPEARGSGLKKITRAREGSGPVQRKKPKLIF